ncbi:MAG: glycosyltransferase family 2 protein [Candidatus Liptonbacteria bacterium]|nr:glycosyltransferase family 2 protein [Candidatus Liptonbacteria bacterium]
MVEQKDDRERIKAFCESRLNGEKLIETPQHENCKVAVVIPARGEPLEQVLNLIGSLTRQKGISPDSFELILVVNLEKQGDSREIKTARFYNSEVLGLPKNTIGKALQRQGIRVFVVDKSSPGLEFEDCNVGRARNRGVAEAVKRFFERGEDGIIIQTDADAWFADETHLARVVRLFERNKNLIGAAGGIRYELNDWVLGHLNFEPYWQNLVLLKQVKRLWQFDPKETKKCYVDFSGANMMSRAFATALIGNVEDRSGGEDTSFAIRMHELARARGLEVRDVKDEFRIATALRESHRTPVNFKCFRGETLEGPLVEDPRKSNFRTWWRKECPTVRKEDAWHRWTAQLPLIPLRKLWRELLAGAKARSQFIEAQKLRLPKEFLDPTGKNDFSFLWND